MTMRPAKVPLVHSPKPKWLMVASLKPRLSKYEGLVSRFLRAKSNGSLTRTSGCGGICGMEGFSGTSALHIVTGSHLFGFVVGFLVAAGAFDGCPTCLCGGVSKPKVCWANSAASRKACMFLG